MENGLNDGRQWRRSCPTKKKQTQKVLSELSKINQLQKKEATRSKKADEATHVAIKDIVRKQEELLETINNKRNAVEELQ